MQQDATRVLPATMAGLLYIHGYQVGIIEYNRDNWLVGSRDIRQQAYPITTWHGSIHTAMPHL